MLTQSWTSCPRTHTRREPCYLAQARQPGQGRREALQCMLEAAEAYHTPEHSQTNATDPSAFGASEHAKQEALARHRDLLQRLRQIRENAFTCEAETQDAKQTSRHEVGVELVTDEYPDCASMGPMDLAKIFMRCGRAHIRTSRTGGTGSPGHARSI